MSLSAAHRAAFRREAPGEKRVFSIRDEDGFPAPEDADGTRAMPFWSRASRAERVITLVGAYRGFDVVEVGLADWLERWLPALRRDGLLVGINWAGAHATGYDLDPAGVAAWLTDTSGGCRDHPWSWDPSAD